MSFHRALTQYIQMKTWDFSFVCEDHLPSLARLMMAIVLQLAAFSLVPFFAWHVSISLCMCWHASDFPYKMYQHRWLTKHSWLPIALLSFWSFIHLRDSLHEHRSHAPKYVLFNSYLTVKIDGLVNEVIDCDKLSGINIRQSCFTFLWQQPSRVVLQKRGLPLHHLKILNCGIRFAQASCFGWYSNSSVQNNLANVISIVCIWLSICAL